MSQWMVLAVVGFAVPMVLFLVFRRANETPEAKAERIKRERELVLARHRIAVEKETQERKAAEACQKALNEREEEERQRAEEERLRAEEEELDSEFLSFQREKEAAEQETRERKAAEARRREAAEARRREEERRFAEDEKLREEQRQAQAMQAEWARINALDTPEKFRASALAEKKVVSDSAMLVAHCVSDPETWEAMKRKYPFKTNEELLEAISARALRATANELVGEAEAEAYSNSVEGGEDYRTVYFYGLRALLISHSLLAAQKKKGSFFKKAVVFAGGAILGGLLGG